MHPHLEVALNRSENFSTSGTIGKFCCFGLVWFLESYVKQKCLGGGITSSGTALLKPCCLVDETEALSRWEEMTLQETSYSSRVIKLNGNNKDMSTRRKGMCGTNSPPLPCTCRFLGLK